LGLDEGRTTTHRKNRAYHEMLHRAVSLCTR